MELTPQATTRLHCPIKECGWSYDDPGPTITFHDDPSLIATSYFVNLDQVARVHLETHSLEDWVREVARLRDEAARYRTALEAVMEIPGDGGTCYDAATVASRALRAGTPS